MLPRLLPVVALALAALAAACGSPQEEVDSSEGAVVSGGVSGSDTALFQDDRVGRQLKDNLANIPQDYPSFEKLFKIGRDCARADGKKEIFIVEEAQTRAVEGSTANVKTTKLMPRAVITGCNTGDPSDINTVKGSFSLMAALVSSERAPGAATGDTMKMTPLEVMAFDDTTGLYNFYVFEPTGPGQPGTVTRFFQKDGTVFQRRLVGGSKTPNDAAPHTSDACFRCHVNGAPLMNELHEPWTNWISPKKKLPTAAMSGTTKALVEQATLADQLEGIILAGTQTYIGGLAAGKGWVNRTRDGLLPGGVSRLLQPLFCETELNYVSADTSLGIPPQVFFDPSVTAGAGLAFPDPANGAPFLFPVRAARDELVERTLIKRDYLTEGMAVAIRLIDDENDIFSAKRCGVWSDVKQEITKAAAGEADQRLEPADVKAVLAKVLTAKLPSLGLQPARLEYLKARLAGTIHQKKQAAYNVEVSARFDALDKNVAKREAARKAAARKLFPNPANPMPILDR
jgi:hypothetical protein